MWCPTELPGPIVPADIDTCRQALRAQHCSVCAVGGPVHHRPAGTAFPGGCAAGGEEQHPTPELHAALRARVCSPTRSRRCPWEPRALGSVPAGKP